MFDFYSPVFDQFGGKFDSSWEKSDILAKLHVARISSSSQNVQKLIFKSSILGHLGPICPKLVPTQRFLYITKSQSIVGQSLDALNFRLDGVLRGGILLDQMTSHLVILVCLCTCIVTWTRCYNKNLYRWGRVSVTSRNREKEGFTAWTGSAIRARSWCSPRQLA